MDNPQIAHSHPPPPPPQSRPPEEKTPLLAGLLSLVLPGLGNIYNGLYLRGLGFAVLCVGLFAYAVTNPGPDLALIVPALVFFWFFNIVDSYRQATLINYGYVPTAGSGDGLTVERRDTGALALGIAVFLLGFYGLLRHLFPRLDLSVVLDYWYLLFLAFGAWLIFQAIRDRRESATEDPASMTGGDDVGLPPPGITESEVAVETEEGEEGTRSAED